MTAEQQHRARQALAFVLQTLRPDWDPPGTIAAIEALHRDRQPLGTIARAAIDAALTPTTKTPGGIAARIRDGFTGAADTQRGTPTPPHVSHMRCTSCGFTVTEPDHRCAPRGDHTAGAARARAELAAAKTATKMAMCSAAAIGISVGDERPPQLVCAEPAGHPLPHRTAEGTEWRPAAKTATHSREDTASGNDS